MNVTLTINPRFESVIPPMTTYKRTAKQSSGGSRFT